MKKLLHEVLDTNKSVYQLYGEVTDGGLSGFKQVVFTTKSSHSTVPNEEQRLCSFFLQSDGIKNLRDLLESA